MANERKGGVTFKGNPMTLIGPELKVGDTAPDFKLLATDLTDVNLGASTGKIRFISVFPSIDTPICEAQTKRFNDEAAKLGANVEVLSVSMDLPFAHKRFCAAAGINHKTLSDHRDGNFAQAYGVLIKELRLCSRAIFIVDAKNKIQYVEYVPEVGAHPNYDAAIAAAKKIAG